jgi:hypothetical protein
MAHSHSYPDPLRTQPAPVNDAFLTWFWLKFCSLSGVASLKRMNKVAGWVAIGAISLVLAIGYLYRVWATCKIRVHLAQLKQAGEPIDYKELDALYPEVHAMENASLVYMQAFAQLKVVDRDRLKELLQRVEDIETHLPLADSNKMAVAHVVATHKSSLKLLHDAAKLSKCRYPISLREGPGTTEHLDGVETSARLLALEGALNAEAGNAAGAMKSIQSLLALGSSLRREPLLVSHSYRFYCIGLAFKLLPRVAQRGQPGLSELTELEKAFEKAAEPVDLGPAFRVERCWRLRVDEKAYLRRKLLETDPDARITVAVIAPIHKALGRFEGDKLFYLENVPRFISASSRPLDERLRLTGEDADRLYERGKRRLFYVSTLFFVDYQVFVLGDIENAARLQVAQALLAIERFRNLHGGRIPVSLKDVFPHVSQAPRDPFDGEVLRFRNYGTNYLVYSIGRDRKDNHGLQLGRGYSVDRAHDLVLRIEQ